MAPKPKGQTAPDVSMSSAAAPASRPRGGSRKTLPPTNSKMPKARVPVGKPGQKRKAADPTVDSKYVDFNLAPVREAFLAALACHPVVSQVCTELKLNPTQVYTARTTDPDFKKAWDEAIDAGVGWMEDQARRRAFTGVPRPVFQGGIRVGEVNEYSDTLAVTMLKRHRPELYNPSTVQKVEHSGVVGTVYASLSDDELDKKLEGMLSFLAASRGVASGADRRLVADAELPDPEHPGRLTAQEALQQDEGDGPA